MTDTMFTTREVPWMTLGRLVDKPVTAADAALMGGLGFDVELRPALYPDRDGNPVESLTRRWVMRVDTDEPLETVSADYTICQYSEAFEILNTISTEFVAAGQLRGGKQGFMVTKAPTDIKFAIADDPHDLFIVARTSHDRSRALEISVMPLRMRCMNQLTLQSFTAGVKHRWSIVHNTNMHDRIVEAKQSIDNLAAYSQVYQRIAERLMNTTVSDDRARNVFRRAVQPYIKPDSREERVDRMVELWKNAETVGFGDSAWGVVQAVSEFYQWDRTSGNTTPESTFIGALQGELHKMTNKAAAAFLTGRA